MNITKSQKIIAWAIFISLSFNSCEENEEPPCGCSGIDGKAIEETYGTVFIHKEKPYLITLESGYITSYDTTEILTNGQVFEEMVGKAKFTCTSIIDTAYAYHEHFDYKATYFEIDSYKELTTSLLYNPITWKQFTIEIIRSEDFGYAVGMVLRSQIAIMDSNFYNPIYQYHTEFHVRPSKMQCLLLFCMCQRCTHNLPAWFLFMKLSLSS